VGDHVNSVTGGSFYMTMPITFNIHSWWRSATHLLANIFIFPKVKTAFKEADFWMLRTTRRT